MKRVRMVLALAAVMAFAAVEPAGAAPKNSTESGAQGGFQMTVHTHSNNPETLLFPDVERLPFDFE